MLENIIAEKTVAIQELESDLLKEQADCRKLEQGLKEKQTVLESYESRFISVRGLIEKQDAELKDSFAKINELRERLANEEDRALKLEHQIQDLTLTNRGEVAEIC